MSRAKTALRDMPPEKGLQALSMEVCLRKWFFVCGGVWRNVCLGVWRDCGWLGDLILISQRFCLLDIVLRFRLELDAAVRAGPGVVMRGCAVGNLLAGWTEFPGH